MSAYRLPDQAALTARLRRKGKIVPSEHAEQKAVIDWWESFSTSKGIDPRLLWATPNGGKRHIRAAVRFKAEGVRAGIPDLFLALPRLAKKAGRPFYYGLFVEMKALDGQTQKNQLEMLQLLREQDYQCVVCRGAEAAIEAIREYVG